MSVIDLPVYRGGDIVVHAKVDKVDFAWARHFRWTLNSHGYVSRSVRKPDPGVIFLHRIVAECAGCDPEMKADHVDGDLLNCTRDNLRAATGAENMQNVRSTRGTSRFRGVSRDADRGWNAKVRNRSLGRFDSELIAAQVAELERRHTMPFAEPDPELARALADYDWREEFPELGKGQGLWGGASQSDSPWDNVDYEIDLGCGRLPKARMGIDHQWSPGVGIVMDLDLRPGERIPLPDSSIKSIITHHCLEHIGEGFLRLMQEIHRVLVTGGVLRIIVPLFPSTSAVADPDHCRYFMEQSFASFYVDDSGGSWLESFSVPYIGTAKFLELETLASPPTPIEQWWTAKDEREMRVAMRKWGS